MQRSPKHWKILEHKTEFRALVAEKRRFIVPATIFFVVYYFALPVLVGFFPDVMSTPVFGKVNLAYLFALSQFFMAWGVMALYVKRARGFDERAQRLRNEVSDADSDTEERHASTMVSKNPYARREDD